MPEKASPCAWPYFTVPSAEVMPYSVTIARAILVACSMSLEAPVVGSPKTSSSAERPPMAKTSWAKSSSRLYMPLSSSSAVMANPPVRPRARIVTL